MIRHVVLLRWRDGTSDSAVAAVTQAFSGLADRIAEIRSVRFGPDLGIFRGNADYALVADFDCEADLRAYVEDPAHQALMKEVTGPIMASFTSSQFELP